MAERQKHGFFFEDYISTKYNIKKNDNYTSVWDGVTEGNIPVSIKTKKNGGSVEMGSLHRNARNNMDFLLIVGFWKNNRHDINNYKIISLLINGEFWSQQFPREAVEKQLNIFDGISNSYSDDKLWKKRRLLYRNEWKKHNSIININPKRDHKKQKRIQCSIKSDAMKNILIPQFSFDLQTIKRS